MAALGTPVSNKFHIGSAELRIGTLAQANKLTQAHSVGLLQSANVNFNQESVDLEGGLPKTLIDSVITKTNVTIEAQAYEYSRRNIQSMVNLALDSNAPTEYDGSVAVDYTIGTTSTEVIETTLLLSDVTVGDMVVFYPPGAPEKVTVAKVIAKVARSAPNASMAKITIDGTKTPLLFDAPIGTMIFKTNTLGLGASTATNYYSMTVLGMEHNTGRPKGFTFWKTSISGGMQYSFSNDNFAVTPMNFKVLQPAASEYAVGGPLAAVADLIALHPFGLYFS